MCTVIVIREPGVPFPVVVAANRDERVDRPAKPFGRPRPEASWQGGLDELAGGTWFGLHDSGFSVYVLNGLHALGPDPGLRSRGLLAVELLESGSPRAALVHLLETDHRTVRPCHFLIVAPDAVSAVSHSPNGWDIIEPKEGVSMWTSRGENSTGSLRVSAHFDAVEAVRATWASKGDIRECLSSLEGLLARPAPEGSPRDSAMCIQPADDGFGTRSSSILAFPRAGSGRPILGRIADGPPDRTRFRRLSVQVD